MSRSQVNCEWLKSLQFLLYGMCDVWCVEQGFAWDNQTELELEFSTPKCTRTRADVPSNSISYIQTLNCLSGYPPVTLVCSVLCITTVWHCSLNNAACSYAAAGLGHAAVKLQCWQFYLWRCNIFIIPSIIEQPFKMLISIRVYSFIIHMKEATLQKRFCFPANMKSLDFKTVEMFS